MVGVVSDDRSPSAVAPPGSTGWGATVSLQMGVQSSSFSFFDPYHHRHHHHHHHHHLPHQHHHQHHHHHYHEAMPVIANGVQSPSRVLHLQMRVSCHDLYLRIASGADDDNDDNAVKMTTIAKKRRASSQPPEAPNPSRLLRCQPSSMHIDEHLIFDAQFKCKRNVNANAM